MANPRKFSEKIALQKQKQAEGTAEFERIMKEVSDATSKDEATYNQRLAECGVQSTIASQALTAQRESRGRSVGVGPMRRPSDRRVDRSPYSSGNIAYLSPPSDSFWRRASSDSAIHQSLIQSPEKDPGSNSPLALSPTSQRRNVQIKTVNNHHDSRRNNIHAANRNSSNIDLRQRSPCGVINNRLPPTNMYTASHENSLAAPIGNNTGSLPDLTSVHFSSSLNKQLVEKEHEHSSSPYSSSPLTISPTALSPTSIPNRYQYSPAHSPSDSNTYSPTHFLSNIRQTYLSVPGNESSNHHFSRKSYGDQENINSVQNHNHHQPISSSPMSFSSSQTVITTTPPSPPPLLPTTLSELSPPSSSSSSQNTLINWNGDNSQIFLGNVILKEVQFDEFRPNQVNQTSHLSFTNLPGLVHMQNNNIHNNNNNNNNSSKTGNISNNSIHGSHGHLSSIGIAAARNLTEYRNPQSRPSPGSSPGLIPSMNANDQSNPSAPCSPVPQNFNNSNSQTYDKYQNQNNDAYNLNQSFHNHFEQFSLDWATLFQSLVEAGCTWTAQVQVDNNEPITNLQTAQNNYTTLQFGDNAFTHLGSLSTTNSTNSQQQQQQQQQQAQQSPQHHIQQLDQDNYIQIGTPGCNSPFDKRQENLMPNSMNSPSGGDGGSGSGSPLHNTNGNTNYNTGNGLGSGANSPHHHHQQQQQQQQQQHHQMNHPTDAMVSQQHHMNNYHQQNNYQQPNTPTSIPEIVFSDFSTSNPDFSKEIFGSLDLELGPMDVVGLQMLSDPNSAMIADSTTEDSFRQDLN